MRTYLSAQKPCRRHPETGGTLDPGCKPVVVFMLGRAALRQDPEVRMSALPIKTPANGRVCIDPPSTIRLQDCRHVAGSGGLARASSSAEIVDELHFGIYAVNDTTDDARTKHHMRIYCD